MSVVGVRITMHLDTVTTSVSKVSVGTSPVVDSLSCVIDLVLSYDNSLVVSQELVFLVGDGIVSFVQRSNGVTSSVESEPLLLFPRFTVSDSQSELTSSNMFPYCKSSSTSHS